MWNLSVERDGGVVGVYEDVLLSEGRIKTARRRERERVLLAKAREGDILRALLLSGGTTPEQTLIEFTDSGFVVEGTTATIKNDLIYTGLRFECWVAEVK